MSKHLHPARKKFTRFSSRLPFEFGMPNASNIHKQASDGSPVYFTRSSSLLRRQVLENAPSVTIKSDDYYPRVLKLERWQLTDFSKTRILFLVPSDALGDCVGMALFMRSFSKHYPGTEIAVLNSASASDIFALVPNIEIFQLFISAHQMARFNHIIDLSEMEGWKDIAQMPVNTEETLCEAFGIAPEPITHRKLSVGPGSKIGIVPMASAPLRTLPPELIRNIIRHLSEKEFEVSVLLNAYQGIMSTYKAELGVPESHRVKYLDGFPTVGGLIQFISDQDYMILADSGPAHITKLFQTQGLAIYTSASGKTLQGRHKNLRSWQSSFAGDWCAAPCGLAKLRATEDGRIGCMGSLNLSVEELNAFPSMRNKGMAEFFTFNQPVPCVRQLSLDFDEILGLLRKDLD
ncbi:MAG: lipopolysaccharide heptosyltransferase family protein [Rhodospirillales bacterium]|nr:lipopolysaccharide heptosyltransferase family protein [Rhodospirillales bacterium]